MDFFEDPYVALSLVVVALVGALVSCAGLIFELRLVRRAQEAEANTIEWPPTYAEILAANAGIPPEPRTHALDALAARKAANHRHSVHCPVCGRFARRMAGTESGIDCSVHGLYARAELATGPVAIVIHLRPEKKQRSVA